MLSLFFLLSLQTNADRNIVCSGKTLITQQWLHVADSAEEGTERNKNIDVIPCFQEWQDTTMIQIPPKSMFSNGHFLFGATSIHSTAFIFRVISSRDYQIGKRFGKSEHVSVQCYQQSGNYFHFRKYHFII